MWVTRCASLRPFGRLIFKPVDDTDPAVALTKQDARDADDRGRLVGSEGRCDSRAQTLTLTLLTLTLLTLTLLTLTLLTQTQTIS